MIVRRQHVMCGYGEKPWPQLVVVVAAVFGREYGSDADPIGSLRISKWLASVATCTGGQLVFCDRAGGVDACEWWRWLRTKSLNYDRVWIVSPSARDTMAALDLWGWLEAGSLTLAGADPWRDEARGCDRQLRKDGYVVLESPPTVVSFRYQDSGQVAVWLDPANWGYTPKLWDSMPASVAYGLDEPADTNATACDTRLTEACRGTSAFLASYFRLCHDAGLNAPAHTAASQAMDGFRTNYMQHSITVHDNERAMRLERSALFGGRCEANFIGDLHAGKRPNDNRTDTGTTAPVRDNVGTIYHLDVNSMYPAVVANSIVPVKLECLTRNVPAKLLLEACKTHCVIADVTVDVAVPVVPTRRNGSMIFPIGQFSTTLCGPEILLAAEYGNVVKCELAAVYVGRKLFTDWVGQLWAFRREAEQAVDAYAKKAIKLILNSLFGKFAQLSRRWVDVPDELPPAAYMQWWGFPGDDDTPVQYRSLAWKVQTLVTRGETAESFPAVTAYVNSYGRARLWDLLYKAGRQHVYYYDTDSLICSALAAANLEQLGEIATGKLGYMSVRGQHRSGRIIGRQAYELDGKLTLSGCPTPAVATGDTHATTVRPAPLDYYLWRGEQPGTERRTASIKLDRPYPFGHVGPDGVVTPISMG